MRIRNKLIMYISLYIAIPFLIFASIAIFLVYNSSLSNEKEHFSNNIENITINMNQYFTYLLSTADFLIRNAEQLNISPNDFPKAFNSLTTDGSNNLKHTYFTNVNGHIISAYPEIQGTPPDFSGSFWNQLSSNQFSNSSRIMINNKTQQPTIIVVDPIFINQRISGAIAVEFNFEILNNLFKIKEHKQYLYYLVDNNGNMIFTNQTSSTYPSVIKEMLNKKQFDIDEISFKNKKYFITASHLKYVPYTLLAMVPKSNFLYSYQQLIAEFLIWILFSIISIYIIGYFSRRSLVEPIEKLVSLTENVTSSTLSSINNTLEIHNKGELSELNEHFKQMIISLKIREERLFKRRTNLIQTLVELLEINDSYTAGHSYRVYRYSSCIAKQMDLSNEMIIHIETAALLHDIGKIGIPQNILNKKNKLSYQEYEIIKNHPYIGHHALERIDDFDKIRKTILHHHEHYNGNGYPYGLRGEEIPIESRIISLADAFDAMTSNRPYRLGMSMEKSFSIILKESGKQFDPRIVSVFRNIYETNIESLYDIQSKKFQQIAVANT